MKLLIRGYDAIVNVAAFVLQNPTPNDLTEPSIVDFPRSRLVRRDILLKLPFFLENKMATKKINAKVVDNKIHKKQQ